MDASDVIALTSVVGSVLVGAGALVSAHLSGLKDRTQAVEMAERDRQQARLETTYVELLTFAEEVGMWAQLVLPVVGGDPQNPTAGLPNMPDPKTEASVRAKTAAFASAEVKRAFDAWQSKLREIRAKVILIQLRHGRAEDWHPSDEGADWTTPWGELESSATR